VLDSAFDHLLASRLGDAAGLLLPGLYLLGWGVNLLSVLLALGSMEVLLSSLQRLGAQP
jgi:hypothetical protein